MPMPARVSKASRMGVWLTPKRSASCWVTRCSPVRSRPWNTSAKRDSTIVWRRRPWSHFKPRVGGEDIGISAPAKANPKNGREENQSFWHHRKANFILFHGNSWAREFYISFLKYYRIQEILEVQPRSCAELAGARLRTGGPSPKPELSLAFGGNLSCI